MAKTILYVDDEPWFTEALVDALIDEGYAVDKALDGGEAIQKIQDAIEAGIIPDLIVLDVIMPIGENSLLIETNGGRRTGLKVHEIIRKQFRLQTPIIFVTVVEDPVAESEIEKLEKSLGMKNFAMLLKPVLPTELLEKVSSMIK